MLHFNEFKNASQRRGSNVLCRLMTSAIIIYANAIYYRELEILDRDIAL